MKIGRMVGPAIATHAAEKTAVHGVGDDYLAKTSQEAQDLSDAEIPAAIARDLEVVNAIAFHAAIATAHQNAPALITAHSNLATGVHGVGASVVCSEAEADNKIAAAKTTGTYTGDDADNRAIPHGLGVIPKFVMIMCTSHAGTALDGFLAGHEYFADVAGHARAVTARTTTNFYVPQDATVQLNAQDKVYVWVAIG